MLYRYLGKNKRNFTHGIGAMSFSDFMANQVQKYLLYPSACLDLGINHVDTADIYGMGSEERKEVFLEKSSARNFFKIASKGKYEKLLMENFLTIPRANLTEALNASLQKLGVDNIELYYVHRRDQSIPIEEVSETLASFVKEGKINQFGYSEIAPTSLDKANEIHPVAAVQSEIYCQHAIQN